MTKKPRGILVVHNDLSEIVARLIVGAIRGKGKPVTRRNVRYGYFSPMYELVLLVGVEGEETDTCALSYAYVPYSEYRRRSEGKLDRRGYHEMYAEEIASKVADVLDGP